MHAKQIVRGGADLAAAKKILILLHGRGATAENIMGLAEELNTAGYALVAPQAENYTWYPNSFLVPQKQNEPSLSSAISVLEEIVSGIHAAGIKDESIFFAGFSQGACLALEFVARGARRWGGVAAFTGGLIGDTIYPEKYSGDFKGTPVFIGSGDPDPHVPVERVRATGELLAKMNAHVTVKIYPGMGHTISADEIREANRVIFG